MVFDFVWEWTRGQVNEQVGGEEKEQGVGCGVSPIFGMQSLKKRQDPLPGTPHPPPKKTQKRTENKQGLKTNR